MNRDATGTRRSRLKEDSGVHRQTNRKTSKTK